MHEGKAWCRLDDSGDVRVEARHAAEDGRLRPKQDPPGSRLGYRFGFLMVSVADLVAPL